MGQALRRGAVIMESAEGSIYTSSAGWKIRSFLAMDSGHACAMLPISGILNVKFNAILSGHSRSSAENVSSITVTLFKAGRISNSFSRNARIAARSIKIVSTLYWRGGGGIYAGV